MIGTAMIVILHCYITLLYYIVILHCYITSFKEEDDCIALSSNITLNTLPKTESGQHFERTER